MVRGVLFDLFHTLTSRESQWADLPWTSDVLGVDRKAWNRLLTASSRWRLAGEERDGRRIVADLARQLKPSVSNADIDRAVRIRIERFRQALEKIPAPNVRLVMQLRAAGVRTALVSNADVMEMAGWSDSPLAGLFDAEVFSCDVGLVKPEVAIYEHALARLGLRASDCLFVGDGGSNELVGAREAGLQTVFVSGVMAELWPDEVPHRIKQADHHIEDVSDLPQLPITFDSAVGLERKKVGLVPHDPRWADLYALEATSICRRLESHVVDVAHIGSTAVAGLEAKPVIDIMLALPSLSAPAAVFEALVELGYVHKQDDPLPDRLFFSRDLGSRRTHNLSVCERESKFWEDHVRFRDLLRCQPALAAAYVELKRYLARQYPNDRLAYTDGKDAFIRKTLASGSGE